MSLPSTPNNSHHDGDDGTPPPSAWKRALGMFSAKKKTPSPASIVNGHAPDSPLSAGTAGNNNDNNDDNFQSPMSSSHFSPANGGNHSFSIGTSPTTARGSQRKPSRLESSTQKSETIPALTNGTRQLSLRPQSAFRNAKSPRKNRSIATTTTTTTGQGSRNGTTTTATVSFQSNKTAMTTTAPIRRYRPSASLFSGSKGGKNGGAKLDNKNNEAKFGQALTEVRDLFLTAEIQDTSTNIYSTKGGMLWGSLDGGPSRFTVKVQKRQRPMQSMRASADEAEEEDNDRRTKRRKKVAFDQQEENDGTSFMTNISATTPHKSNKNNHGLKRKDTPMPAKTSHQVSFESPAPVNMEDNEEEEERSMPSAQKLPSPPPQCEFDFDALNSEQPVAATLPPAQSYDAAPDPEASQFAFRFRPTAVRTSNPTATGLVSTTSRANYEEKRYERPASPVRNRTTRNQNDDEANQQGPTKRSKRNNSQATEVIPDWVCTHCDTKNNNDETVCQKEGCGKVRPFSGVKLGWGGLMQKLTEGKWKCLVCHGMVLNTLDACPSCEEKKPDDDANANGNASSTQASASTNKPAAAEPQFLFQATAPDAATTTTTTGGFTFAAPPASASAPATATGGFLFQAPKSSSKDEEEKKVEAPTPAAGAAPTDGFLFGGTRVPISSSAPSFGTNGKLNGTTTKLFESKPMGENGDKKPVQFGQTAKTGDAQSTSTPAAQSSTGSPVSVSFGASSGFASSAASGNGGQFGSTPATEEKPKRPGYDISGNGNGVKMPPTLFGAPAAAGPAPAPASGTTFQFGTTSAPKDTEESSGSGNTSSSQFGNPTGGGVQFGTSGGFSTTPSSQAPAPSAASGGFGAPSSGAPAPLFGSGTPIPAFASATTAASGNFGAPGAAAPLFGSGTPIPAFGSTTTDASGGFGASSGAPTPAPLFGSGTPIPAFGSSTGATTAPSSAPAFGSTGSTPAPAATNFGSTPAPAAADFGTSFGTTTTATPLAPAFGTTTTTPAPAATGFGTTPAPAAPDFGTGFGTAPAAAAFGSTPASTGFNATTFGANPTSATGMGFGGAPSANFGSSIPQAATPAAFAPQGSAAPGGFGSAGFGTQAPAASGQGFDASAFGSDAFGGIPGLPGGLGSNGFGASQANGFPSTPAPAGGFNGGGYGATAPNTAPPDAGFSIGSAGKPKRRMIRAKRPTTGSRRP